MRRTAIMLLQHGPLTLREFCEIMGSGTRRQHENLLYQLVSDGVVKRIKMGTYALATI